MFQTTLKTLRKFSKNQSVSQNLHKFLDSKQVNRISENYFEFRGIQQDSKEFKRISIPLNSTKFKAILWNFGNFLENLKDFRDSILFMEI